MLAMSRKPHLLWFAPQRAFQANWDTVSVADQQEGTENGIGGAIDDDPALYAPTVPDDSFPFAWASPAVSFPTPDGTRRRLRKRQRAALVALSRQAPGLSAGDRAGGVFSPPD